MQIKVQPMGVYQTNCYIVSVGGKDLIIDPGVKALEWIKENVTNPIAVLNTHGHFDHVWSNQEVKEYYNIPLYTPKDDIPMLTDNSWVPDLPPSSPDVKVTGEVTTLSIGEIDVTFRHYPGHCPGCSTIEIEDAMFSGDFIFDRSIGRTDFPYSSPEAMKTSLERFMTLDFDKTVYPGHGGTTTIKVEQRNAPYWIQSLN